MPNEVKILLDQYVEQLNNVYGSHLKSVILYGSYARGDFRDDSDIDIMILLDLDDLSIKDYRHKLSDVTYDFNMSYDIEIKPIAKSRDHFNKWLEAYAFYSNIAREGVTIFEES